MMIDVFLSWTAQASGSAWGFKWQHFLLQNPGLLMLMVELVLQRSTHGEVYLSGMLCLKLLTALGPPAAACQEGRPLEWFSCSWVLVCSFNHRNLCRCSMQTTALRLFVQQATEVAHFWQCSTDTNLEESLAGCRKTMILGWMVACAQQITIAT